MVAMFWRMDKRVREMIEKKQGDEGLEERSESIGVWPYKLTGEP